MNVQPTRSTLWTLAVLFLSVLAIIARLPWAILWVPGVLLMWYGVLKADQAQKIAVQDRSRTGLN